MSFPESSNRGPIKPNFKRDDGFSAYYTRDCHGPPGYGEGLCRDESGLATTFLGAFLKRVARAKLVIDLAVEGIVPERFFSFYGELLFALSKPVDVIDLSSNTKFNKLVYRDGIRLYISKTLKKT